MDTKPLVSVIIPNYNHARYLHKRISSVLQQTFQDFEVIILDDCSTDHSRTVIQGFAAKHDQIILAFNQQNSKSPFKQWNKGVEMAQGKYIWIAESDDFADTRFLETLLPCLEENGRIGVAYCQSWVVNEQDEIIENKLLWTEDLDPNRWKYDYINNGLDECERFLFHKPTIPNTSAVLFRKDIYFKAGMAAEDYAMCGDWMHWIKMLLISDVCFKAESLNYFRRHTGTTRHILTNDKVLNKIEEEYKILAYILQHAELDPKLRRKLVKDFFDRSINFCPSSLKASFRFFDFLKIVRRVDNHAYIKTLTYIAKRSITYIPEKLSKN